MSQGHRTPAIQPSRPFTRTPCNPLVRNFDYGSHGQAIRSLQGLIRRPSDSWTLLRSRSPLFVGGFCVIWGSEEPRQRSSDLGWTVASLNSSAEDASCVPNLALGHGVLSACDVVVLARAQAAFGVQDFVYYCLLQITGSPHGGTLKRCSSRKTSMRSLEGLYMPVSGVVASAMSWRHLHLSCPPTRATPISGTCRGTSRSREACLNMARERKDVRSRQDLMPLGCAVTLQEACLLVYQSSKANDQNLQGSFTASHADLLPSIASRHPELEIL